MRSLSLIVIFLLLFFNSCTKNSIEGPKLLNSKIKISGPKIISIQSLNYPWLYSIQRKIEGYGFLIYSSREKKLRYELVINGKDQETRRCLGGGWSMEYLNATLFDNLEKKEVAYIEGTGFTENCPPMSGRIFTEIALMIDNLWVTENTEFVQYDLDLENNKEETFGETDANTKNNKGSKLPESIVIPVSSLGEVSEVRKQILQNTLEDELKSHFLIISQEKYEKVQEMVFEELDYEECTEDQCIMMIQEMLQVENVFHLQVLGEGKDTQLSLSWRTLDEKRKEEEFCEDCGTGELRKMIDGLVEKLVGMKE